MGVEKCFFLLILIYRFELGLDCSCTLNFSVGVKVCRAIILTGWVSDEDKLDAPKQNACRSFVSLESWNQGLSMI